MLDYLEVAGVPGGYFSGYIFDCDGTLAQSTELHYKAWLHALEIARVQCDFSWNFFRSTAGMGLQSMLALMEREFKVKMDVERILEAQEGYVAKHMGMITPNEEVVSLARQVAELGLPRSVASGNHRPVIEKTLEIIGVADLFDVVVSQDDVELGKPHPSIFLLAAELMGVAPERCLVLEDSMLGVEAAVRAGMGSVLVRLD